MEDIAQALTDSLPRDGSAGMSNDLPMGGNQITGMGAATAANHAIRFDQAAKGPFLISASALTMAANEMIYASGANVAAKTALTPFARAILADDDAEAVRDTIAAAPSWRLLNAGDGLTGGGDLTANRTFSVDGTVVRTVRSVTGGNGMTGGGNLTSDRIITLGTPSSITDATTNSVTTTSHTHELPESGIRGRIAQGSIGQTGTYAMLRLSTGGVATPGQNIPASAIDGYASVSGDATGAVTGTWKCMGRAGGAGNNDRTTTFLRVS